MHKTYSKKLALISIAGITFCILLWASSSAILIHSIEKKVREIEVQHTVLINTERLSYLNEKLTDLSQKYFNTQNKKWLKEHSDYTNEYKSIEAKISNYNLTIFNDWYKHINADSIIILENIAFKLAEKNHFDKAINIINSKKYLKHKTDLSNSYKSILYNLEDGYNGLQNNLNSLITDSDELWIFLSVLILLVSILLFISLNSIFRFIKELKKSKEKEKLVLKNLSQVNNSLAASQKNQENLLLSLGKGIVILDAEANIIDSNQLFQEIIGYSKNELSYLSIPQLIHPEDYERSQKYFQELKNIGYYSEYEGRILNKKGDYIWVSVSSTAIIENDVFCGSRDIVRDISHEKATEEKLKVMNNVIAHITTNTANKIGNEYFISIIKLLNKSLNVDYSFIAKYNKEENTATTEYLCCNNEIIDNISYSLKGTPCGNVMNSDYICVPNFVQELFPHDSLLIQMGINGYLGVAIKNSQDECTHILVSLSKKPIKDIEYHSRILENIGYSIKKEIERTDLYKNIQENERHFKNLFDSAPDSVFVISLEEENRGVIINANKQAHDSHGYNKGELIGKNISELDVPDSKKHIEDRIEQVLKGKKITFEVEHFCKDGSTIPFEVTAAKININGKQNILAFNRDISERKKITYELSKSEEKYKEFFNSYIDIYFEENEENIIEVISPSVFDILGYKPEEIIGHDSHLFIANQNELKSIILELKQNGKVRGNKDKHN